VQQQQLPESNDQRQRRGFTNSCNTRNRPLRGGGGGANSAALNSNTNNSRPPRQANLPNVNYSMLSKLIDKSPDEILIEMLQPNFQLKRFLKDERMKNNTDWILTMTKLLEKITQCEGSRERVVMVLGVLHDTNYLENGVYDLVRKPDPITDQLRYEFIQSFLKIAESILNMIPSSADDLTKIVERIELHFTKTKNDSSVR